MLKHCIQTDHSLIKNLIRKYINSEKLEFVCFAYLFVSQLIITLHLLIPDISLSVTFLIACSQKPSIDWNDVGVEMI